MKSGLASLTCVFSLLSVASARESITLDLKVEQTARQALAFPASTPGQDTKARSNTSTSKVIATRIKPRR